MSVEKKRMTKSERASAYVAKMDAAIQGSGGDRQTFIVACKLVEFGLSSSEALAVLQEYNDRCDPKWSDAALSRKLKCAFSRAKPNPDFVDDADVSRDISAPEVKEVSRWPKVNEATRRGIIESGGGLADLCDLSPVSWDIPPTFQILNILFPGNPLICCGKSSQKFWTRKLDSFEDFCSQLQLIVPSPMSKLMGRIQDPEPDGPTESAHTKDNTGDRRFAVVEFDKGNSDEHSALLWHLGKYAPLVMAVHSGGKSLHGWFFVDGSPEPQVFRFYRYAVSIGADRATFLKSQFVRMPGGRRDTGVLQPVYYFNPEAIK